MKKDLFILNLINNRINKKKFLNNNNKNKEIKSSSFSPNIVKTNIITLNVGEVEKKNVKIDYPKIITSLIKNKFFNFNPIKSKNNLIQYREMKNKNFPIYKGKERKIKSQYYSNLIKQKLREQTYQTWQKINNEYLNLENSEDKYLKTDYSLNNNAHFFSKNNPNFTLKNFSVGKKNFKKIYPL